MPKRNREYAAIVDTNVITDIISFHDVMAAKGKPTREKFYRFDRAGHGLRVAIHLHDARAVTLLAGREALTIATQRVPPEQNDIAGWYLRTWLLFTKPKLLPNWVALSKVINGTGNAVDDALVELARQHKCPLISNEGIGPDGPTGNDRIRTKAAAAGVRVLTSEEFARRHPLSRTRVKRFIGEFAKQGPVVCRWRAEYRPMQALMSELHDYYVKLLLGTDLEAVAERRARPAE